MHDRTDSPAPRVDPHLGTVVHVVASRQTRPNLPVDGCPFCVGGLEAPEPYDVRAFPNRWPALGAGRCEVVLYSPDHDDSLVSIGADGARRVVDLWAERTTALLADPSVQFVLPFENRGAEIGATIAHPHGQIYAFDHVPSRQTRLLRSRWTPESDPGDRLITSGAGWVAYARWASVHPVSLVLAPTTRVDTVNNLDAVARDGLATLLVDVLGRLDRLFGTVTPYMLWVNQAPRESADVEPWLHVEIVSPWRGTNLPRYIAAAEIATEEYFNPVDPADLAARLRSVG